MAIKNIVDSIEKLVSSGSIKEPFTVDNVNRVGSNLLDKSPSFLSKHSIGNPGKYKSILGE